jgi:hypothetical protein
MKKLTTHEFIENAKLIHGNKYDYSVVNYINSRTKIQIICSKKHLFTQIPNSHLQGNGCPNCNVSKKLSIDDVKNLCYKFHGETHTILSNFYKNQKSVIEIKHNICGNIFNTNYINLYSGCGCPKCFKSKKLSIDILKERCYNLHKDEYKILDNNYINNHTKIMVKHNKCGHQWLVKPNHFSNGSCCPNCYNKSKGENKIKLFLESNKIDYTPQHGFKDCKYKQVLNFDFYLPKYNICIEFDGRQHFEPVEKFGGVEEFELTKIRDSIKNSYCEDNNIKLIRIPYTKLNKIDEILDIHII